MGRSPLFSNLARTMRIALYCEREQITTEEGMQRVAAMEEQAAQRRISRRDFLADMSRFAAAGMATTLMEPSTGPIISPFAASNITVGIVGAGLAGLVCATQLKQNNVNCTLYDATTRVGGRCYSLNGLFPGQVAERGGEFIDNLHKTMLGYAQQFNLAKEDVTKQPGEIFYYFDGQHYPEAIVVEQYRAFVATMRGDLNSLSGDVTAEAHSDADVRLDNINLRAYLEGSNSTGAVAGPVVKNAIIEAYEAEYGLAAEEQSCLNFLLFIHADKRSKFTPFGVFSDERWHLIDGNDKIPQNLANQLPGQIQYGMQLVKVLKTSAGRYELTFKSGTKTIVKTHDAIVLAIPFTVLRTVELHASLGIPPAQRSAINLLGYGTNAKMMIGFSRRPWVEQGSNGSSYADLANCQTTWETNPINGTATRGIITDYSSGPRGASLNPGAVQTEAGKFLADLDKVFPGALAAATRKSGKFVVHLEHWPSHPLTRGSYTCYKPGQFTSIAGLEGKPVGNLHFAGEHTNSFYIWQGFMEGAALSGIQAASEILQDIKVGNL